MLNHPPKNVKPSAKMRFLLDVFRIEKFAVHRGEPVVFLLNVGFGLSKRVNRSIQIYGLENLRPVEKTNVNSNERKALTTLMNAHREDSIKLQLQALDPQTDQSTHNRLICESMALLRAYHQVKDTLEGIDRQSADTHY